MKILRYIIFYIGMQSCFFFKLGKGGLSKSDFRYLSKFLT